MENSVRECKRGARARGSRTKALNILNDAAVTQLFRRIRADVLISAVPVNTVLDISGYKECSLTDFFFDRSRLRLLNAHVRRTDGYLFFPYTNFIRYALTVAFPRRVFVDCNFHPADIDAKQFVQFDSRINHRTNFRTLPKQRFRMCRRIDYDIGDAREFQDPREGVAERKSDREGWNQHRELQAKEGRTGTGVSSIIRLFTSETACKCYSICLMESFPSFLGGVSPRDGIPRLPISFPLLLFLVSLVHRSFRRRVLSRVLSPPRSPLNLSSDIYPPCYLVACACSRYPLSASTSLQTVSVYLRDSRRSVSTGVFTFP